MLMSPATSLARPLNQCPYCDHVSPANSKFCNECGAALHLKPCPHCGAVNDVTLTSACARCNGALNEGTAVALVEPAAPRPTLASSTSPPLRLLLVAMLALGGLGLYAFQQKQPGPQLVPQPVPPAAAPVRAEAVPQAETATAVTTPLINVPESGASEALLAATPPAAGQPAVAPKVAARPRPDPNPGSGSGIEPPAPNIGPCTDAVAALGLCTPTPGRP